MEVWLCYLTSCKGSLFGFWMQLFCLVAHNTVNVFLCVWLPPVFRVRVTLPLKMNAAANLKKWLINLINHVWSINYKTSMLSKCWNFPSIFLIQQLRCLDTMWCDCKPVSGFYVCIGWSKIKIIIIWCIPYFGRKIQFPVAIFHEVRENFDFSFVHFVKCIPFQLLCILYMFYFCGTVVFQ